MYLTNAVTAMATGKKLADCIQENFSRPSPSAACRKWSHPFDRRHSKSWGRPTLSSLQSALFLSLFGSKGEASELVARTYVQFLFLSLSMVYLWHRETDHPRRAKQVLFLEGGSAFTLLPPDRPWIDAPAKKDEKNRVVETWEWMRKHAL